jgi:pimeloyl-ACP methyl ester carboxylesterase
VSAVISDNQTRPTEGWLTELCGPILGAGITFVALWKVWLRRGIVVLIFAATLAAALCAAALVPYFLASRLASIYLLAFSSILSFAVTAWLGARICATAWRTSRSKRFAAVSSGLLTMVFVIALYLLILRPTPLRLAEAPRFANTRYWQLSTGSRIAYTEYDPPAGATLKPEPIVFVHGGPGLRQAPFDAEFYGGFANDGFRVVLYDQAGSGLSGFLPRLRDYTIARSVEDLEAIRLNLGADRMILIGHSWGSTLAASYMAKYPAHVAKVVFHSPGMIWHVSQDSFDFDRTDGGKQIVPALRLLAALFLQVRNPDSAEHLVSQREAEELVAPAIVQMAGTLVCKGDSGTLPSVFATFKNSRENPAFNPYVSQALVPQTENPEADPHPALRNIRTPAILLYGECNYLSWGGAVDYRNTLPNLKIYYIPRAGHYIQFEQPELLRRVILAFLLDQHDAVPPYTSDVDPRSGQP